jgi:hypothetical protein
MKLATLDDVRRLVDQHLPAEYRAKFAWRQMAGLLRLAAEGRRTWLRSRLHCRLRSKSRGLSIARVE